MKKIVQIFLLLSVCFGYAQKLPKKPKPGMCYERCFDYEAEFEWIEINCDSIKQGRRPKGYFKIKGEDVKDFLKNRIKFKNYQNKLISLGYNLQVTGKMDQQTIKAHSKYLDDKTKAAKQEAKRLKKARRDSIKNSKS